MNKQTTQNQPPYLNLTLGYCRNCVLEVKNYLAESVIVPEFIKGCELSVRHCLGVRSVTTVKCRAVQTNVPCLKLTNDSRREYLKSFKD